MVQLLFVTELHLSLEQSQAFKYNVMFNVPHFNYYTNVNHFPLNVILYNLCQNFKTVFLIHSNTSAIIETKSK